MPRAEGGTETVAGSKRHSGNLPAEVTSFVGRRRELSEARQSLTRTRLLTLTGAGGLGKTRLALRLASEVRRSFPDGTWVVDLSPVEDGSLLARTVVTALRIDRTSALPPMAALIAHLAERRSLLVLDNCEHLRDACAALTRALLAAAPDLQVVATSRQALGVDGECLLTVPPLSAPDPQCPPPLASMTRYDTVQLFVERASAVVGGFTLTEEDRLAVAGICHRLDGMPLAIELAAAWLRVLSPRQILSYLNDRFGLLDRGCRVAPPRQQTLRAAIDWSYDLCTPQEQCGWARLSAFGGEFDLEAAEAVCVGDELERRQILDVVSRLVDKSVLIRNGGHGTARYRMLETIRQYGRARLHQAGAETVVRRRHRDYYQQLVARAESDWFSARQDAWFATLRRELANILMALEFCLTAPQESHAGLRLASSLWSHGLIAGGMEEARHWLGRALTLETGPSTARVKALWVDGWLAFLRGDTVVGRDRLAECQALAGGLGDAESLAHAMEFGGLAALFESDFLAAAPLLEEALDRHRATGDLWAQWTALFLLALTHCLTRDPRAATTAQQCLALCETHDAILARSYTLWLLGLQHWLHGENRQAITRLRDGLRLTRSGCDLLSSAQCLEVLAWATAQEGNSEHAATLLGAAQTARQSIGAALPGLGHLLHHHTECENRLRNALGDTAYDEAVRAGIELTRSQASDYALDGSVAVAASNGTSEPAHTPLTRRERQVVELLSQGLTDRQIAAKLVISPRTAEGHVQRMLAKLGFTSRTQAATWALKESRLWHDSCAEESQPGR
ncbi:ATP-binding protein [Streptomyces platensis]|uniref:ATP-binding protein n=1 Tax=Streptomyces platensis TaxID=58346 RepID=UPI002E25D764|nr:LuxR C-terminal-related transcriptional regulator [Streptomyces platensis]